MTSAPQIVLDFESALTLLRARAGTLCTPAQSESIPLAQSLSRVLAAAVQADRDQPPFHRSTRDGFALSAAYFTQTRQAKITGTLKAGDSWNGPPLAPGEAIEIMTGAPVPAGADAVAMVEHVTQDKAVLTAAPDRLWSPGENIVPRGAEARAGQCLIPARTLVTAAEIALAAACGQSTLTVFRQPAVAIVATGDELVELDETRNTLAPQQIWNSNSHALAALVTAAGADPYRLPITPDTREAVAASLERARQADLIVFSGGVSMGQYDLVEEVLQAAGAEFLFTGVRMQPGKPVVFGLLPDNASRPETYFFGLPGNPISTQVTFHCFVEPFLRTLAGASPSAPRWALATLTQPEPRKPDLTRLLPARMAGTQLTIVPWQGSGDLAANARANCYAELPAGSGTIPADTPIRVLLR